MSYWRIVFSLMWGMVAVGCAGGATKEGAPSGEGGESVVGCESSFEVVDQRATENTVQQVMYFVAKDSRTVPFNKIVLTSFQGGLNQGPTGPGIIDLSGSTYSTCDFCAVAYLNCTSESTCETTLFADEGTVSITDLSELSLPFKAELSGVVFKEIELDTFTHLASVVEGGRSWCAEDFHFEAKLNRYDPSAVGGEEEGSVEPGVAYEECVASGSGKGVGHNIADYSLQNCAGESVPLHSRCGTTKAVWIIASAGW